MAVIAVFGMFGFSSLMLLGMRMISGVYGSVVMAATPAVTAAAAIVLLGEAATWRKIAALALAVGGVALLQVTGEGGGTGGGMDGAHGSPESMGTADAAGNDGSDAPDPAADAVDPVTAFMRGLPSSTLLGMALVFGAVCCEATYTLVGRRMSREVDPVLVAFLAAALSLPLFAPLAAVQWASFEPAEVGWRGWAATLWYGAGTLALGSWLWYAAVARVPGTVAAGFMGLMPVSALALSYVLLGEGFHWVHMACFGIVFAGVLLMSWEHARMSGDR